MRTFQNTGSKNKDAALGIWVTAQDWGRLSYLIHVSERAGKHPPEKGCFSEKRVTSLLLLVRGSPLCGSLVSLVPWEDYAPLAPYSWERPQKTSQF